MRKLKRVKAWISEFTCCSCGATVTMHHGETTKEKALADIPYYDSKIAWSGRWNGWFVGIRNKELCPHCSFINKKLRKKLEIPY